MLAISMSIAVDGVCDMYAAGRVAGAPPPPMHAINRGMLVEGLGALLAGLLGSGDATCTYTENVAALAITRVAMPTTT